MSGSQSASDESEDNGIQQQGCKFHAIVTEKSQGTVKLAFRMVFREVRKWQCLIK
jgi:hypothetical protein